MSVSGTATFVRPKHARIKEDWLAVWIGLFLFVISFGVTAGADLLGWAVSTKVWMDPTKALGTVSAGYAGLPGLLALALTYAFLLVLLLPGVLLLACAMMVGPVPDERRAPR